MTRRLLAIVAACVVTAGCASQPATDPAIKPMNPTTGDESPQRARARIHTELAAGYYQLGNMNVAVEEIAVATQSDPGYAPAYTVAGLIYASLNQDRQAEQNFRHALSIDPTNPNANHNFGQYLCQRKREKEGIQYFMAAVKNPLYRTPESSYVNAGACARQMGDSVAAENFFRQALRVRPNQPQALFNLSEMAYERKDYGAAKREMDSLMRVIKPNAEALWLALRIERGLGDSATAASYAQQLRKNFPDSKEARALGAGQF